MLSRDCLQLICEHITDIKTLSSFQWCSKRTFQFAQLQKKKIGYRFYGERANAIKLYEIPIEDGDFLNVVRGINSALRNGKDEYTDDVNSIDLTSLNTGDIIYQCYGYRGTTTYAFYKNKFIYIMTGSGYADIPKKISKLIQNPYDFYSELSSYKLYQGITNIIMPDGRICMLINGYPEYIKRV